MPGLKTLRVHKRQFLALAVISMLLVITRDLKTLHIHLRLTTYFIVRLPQKRVALHH